MAVGSELELKVVEQEKKIKQLGEWLVTSEHKSRVLESHIHRVVVYLINANKLGRDDLAEERSQILRADYLKGLT